MGSTVSILQVRKLSDGRKQLTQPCAWLPQTQALACHWPENQRARKARVSGCGLPPGASWVSGQSMGWVGGLDWHLGQGRGQCFCCGGLPER